MKRTEQEAAQTKQTILDAALNIFSQKGYNATRLQDIASAAGVTRGAVYHHFGNKAGLFQELVESASQGGNTVIAEAIAEGGSFVEICERILTRSFEMIAKDRKMRETMMLYLFKTDISSELSQFSETLREQAITAVQGLAGFMQMGIGAGQLNADLDPEVAARAFLAYQNGVIQLWLTNPDAFSLEAQAAQLAKAFLYGFAPN
ncbi:MAG: TetR family transcriptional regulator [Chloroflexota bacterium]